MSESFLLIKFKEIIKLNNSEKASKACKISKACKVSKASKVSNQNKLGKLIIFAECVKKDIVFSIALLLAITSSALSMPKLEYIDFKVLICLFNLMIVIKAFESIKLLDKFAVSLLNRCNDSRTISFILVLLAFFMSMLVTNDIALITLVPITLIISTRLKASMLTTIILETLAANIGSSLTPMGNPQNLYIFSYYNLTSMQFFSTIILFSASGFVWLYYLNRRGTNKSINVRLEDVLIGRKKEATIWIVLFALIILSVFNVISYLLALLITLIVAGIIGKRIIFEVDYLLLLTFVCFFVFIGNISALPQINRIMESMLNSGKSTFLSSVIVSQFISNVPASIFLSKFTPFWRELLLGVNIGGMGTLIASLASVISYKYYVRSNTGEARKYIIKFSKYNFLSLIFFTIVTYLVL